MVVKLVAPHPRLGTIPRRPVRGCSFSHATRPPCNLSGPFLLPPSPFFWPPLRIGRKSLIYCLGGPGSHTRVALALYSRWASRSSRASERWPWTTRCSASSTSSASRLRRVACRGLSAPRVAAFVADADRGPKKGTILFRSRTILLPPVRELSWTSPSPETVFECNLAAPRPEPKSCL